MIYLATPYSYRHKDEARVKEVQRVRYEQALWALSILAQHKIPCYCPIVQWHPVALEYNLPGDADFWWEQDKTFLNVCSAGWFLYFQGWEESRGMAQEAGHLSMRGKPAIWLQPQNLSTYCELYLKGRP